MCRTKLNKRDFSATNQKKVNLLVLASIYVKFFFTDHTNRSSTLWQLFFIANTILLGSMVGFLRPSVSIAKEIRLVYSLIEEKLKHPNKGIKGTIFI